MNRKRNILIPLIQYLIINQFFHKIKCIFSGTGHSHDTTENSKDKQLHSHRMNIIHHTN